MCISEYCYWPFVQKEDSKSRRLNCFRWTSLPFSSRYNAGLQLETSRCTVQLQSGVTESVHCSLASLRLHPNSQARRTCSPSGEWGPVDVSGCTFRCKENVSGVLIVTVNTTATRGEVVSSTGVDRLRDQVRIVCQLTVG